jgi:hypothetical protein
MGKKKKKHEYDYFEMMVQAVKYSCKAADMLKTSLQDFAPDTLTDKMSEMHEIEHSGDIAKHEMMSELVRAFITPIDREDIHLLIQGIDDVTDAIEDVLLRLYMFNVQSVRDEALEFADVIVTCCAALKAMLKEFRHFRKSSSIQDSIVEINRLEEEGDALYTRSVRRLYTTSSDPVELSVWSEIFDRMEKCCDACEAVANQTESVLMKNA